MTRAAISIACLACLAIACSIACSGKRSTAREDASLAQPDKDGGPPAPAPAPAWPELAGLPRVEPAHVVRLPVKPDAPRFSVGGPELLGDLAVVASSQFGFIAVDWRRGAIAWTKPAGLRVAPPLRTLDDSVVLIGDCLTPPALPSAERLLGCMRVVAPSGAEQAYMAIRGGADSEEFAAARGPQALWRDGDRAVRWLRGDQAIAIDILSGRASPASTAPPPLEVAWKGRRWEIEHTGGRIVARDPQKRRVAWRTENEYTALVGTVWLPDAGPALRIATRGAGGSAIRVIDMDATGSLNTANARPMPGIALLGWSTSSVGDAALAIRLDTSLRRDFIAGYAANAMIMWAYPLPEQARPDPVGVAVAPEAVVIFHDGDTLTILPELSAPPTAPGAVRAASQIPTP